MRLPKIHLCFLAVFILFAYGSSVSGAEKETQKPVIIGFDGEIGHRTSTSDDAVITGIKIAIREINDAGGVLGGRPMKLLVKDNRSVPARGVANMKAFAEIPDLVAVVGGKFSPVMLEQIPIIHEKNVILLDAWGAADTIIDNGRNPNFCFRLSLKDSWAVQTMMEYAIEKGVYHIGVLLPITGWGRSNEKAIRKYVENHTEISLTNIQWYNWGDLSLIEKYEQLRKTGAEAIFLIANEKEGSILVKEVARLPPVQRLPFISHWGVSGGAFVELTGGAIKELDFSLVQTYSFFDNRREKKLAEFYTIAGELFGIKGPGDIPSPVGTAHAYDLTHILAMAIDLAGSTERAKIRDSLEQVRDYDGLIKFYPQPFTETRHEALLPEDLFMGYFREDGAILRLAR